MYLGRPCASAISIPKAGKGGSGSDGVSYSERQSAKWMEGNNGLVVVSNIPKTGNSTIGLPAVNVYWISSTTSGKRYRTRNTRALKASW